MVRAVFIGYENRLNHVVAHWLSQHTDLVGIVWIPSSEQWHRTWKGRYNFVRKRVARRNLLKVLDEAAFHLFYRLTVKTSHDARAANELIDAYWKQVPSHTWGSHISSSSINDPKVIQYLSEVKPDVIFAHCLNEFFGKKLREIARHGVYIWHVGILPEYRGLYSPFWTLHNLDLDNFGYTLFRAAKEVDAGEIYVQGRISNVDVRRDNNHYIEHKAILGSFPDVSSFIASLESDAARPITRESPAIPGYYSYPGMTDYIRQRWRVRRGAIAPRGMRLRLPTGGE